MEGMRQNAKIENYPWLFDALNSGKIKIYTDHGIDDILPGFRVNLKKKYSNSRWKHFFPQLVGFPLYLFFHRFINPQCIYVTFGNSISTYILMTLQFIFSLFLKPRPHVLFDCLWETNRSLRNKITVAVRSFLVHQVISKVVVYCQSDIIKFNTALKIERQKLIFIPYHHTLEEFSIKTTDNGFIFSGGDPFRDYAPLIQVCEELQIPLKIATHKVSELDYNKTSDLFVIRPTTPQVYNEWLSSCRFMVLPFCSNIPRTVGHQTFINAMLLEKPVVFYNKEIAEGYITNGVNGIVIESGDYSNFKDAIFKLYHSPELRLQIGQKARESILKANLCPEEWVLRTYNSVSIP